jgi:hypothetical protein
MQDSGPPGTLQASPPGTTQEAVNIGPIPAPPQQGLKPADLVSAFLEVSASYSTYPGIVRKYLTPQEAKAWNPQWSATVFNSVPSVTQLPVAKGKTAAKQVIVTVQGQVQATFSGSGQYLSVAQGLARSSCAKEVPSYTCEQFTVTQSDGQWRIAKLPPLLLLDESDFSRVYQPQDLYFFDPTYKVLVPDTVFVPLGTPVQQLLTTLVHSLIPLGGGAGSSAPTTSQSWLNIGTTVSSFPAGTKQLSRVTIVDSTATVNLGGAIAQASQQTIDQVMAQLAWTLIGSPGPLNPITAVDLDINGIQRGTLSQTTAYAPYPAKVGVFTYIDNGLAQSRCGSTLATFTGSGTPVFAADGTPSLATCGGVGATASPSPTAPAGQQASGKSSPPGTTSTNPLTAVAASPDGDYLAGVSTGHNSVSIWNLNAHSAAPSKWSAQGQTISSISWDRQDDLWVVARNNATQASSIYVLPAATGQATAAMFSVSGTVLSLSVAPDGVRAALIVQSGSGAQQVELAGIYRGGCQDNCGRPNSLVPELIQGPPLGGPDITDAISLTWYNRDNLYVLDKTGPTSALWEVPVSGRSPSGPDQVLVPSGSSQVSPGASGAYAETIAADNTDNVLVAGMSNGQLLISPGLNQPWQLLGAGAGSAPAYGVNP